MNITAINIGASTSNALSNNLVQSSFEDLDDSFSKTPTNGSNILIELNLQNKINEQRIINENFGSFKNDEDTDVDENDVTLEEKMLNDVERLLYNNNIESDFEKYTGLNKPNLLNPHSLPQLPIYSYPNCYASKTMSEYEHNKSNDLSSKYSNKSEPNFLNCINEKQSNESIKSIHSSSSSSISSAYSNQNKIKKENKESHKRKIVGLFNDFKLNPFNFHSLETFGRFIHYSLNLKTEVVKEIISNPRIQYWIDKNRCHGFVYQTYPRIDETKRRVPPVRCELCKFYGHLSHTCSIKELAFKLNNVVLKNGACRCHICGQLGHPAEAGLCPYIACSFCNQNGHWNYMCPNKDNISRTQCFKCQRYGHSTERCPDHWRQFDRISTFEQTPYKDASETNKPVYCYQCAQKGHYGYNCPDFHRKYFIRDYHQLDTYPVYFFAASSPFIKFSVKFNENDKRIVNHLVEKPIDDRFSNKSVEEDPLEQLEKYQAKVRNENVQNLSIFDETHANMPLKEYIRKWSNWVIDFHWIFTLKYFIEFLPTNKLHFFIKNYPSLDNFILHWMWWSYSLNKDLERFTKDPFRAIGSMPWLTHDVCDKVIDKQKFACTQGQDLTKFESNPQKIDQKLNDKSKSKQDVSKKLVNKVLKQPSKFFQYNEFTIKTIGSLLFQENSKEKFSGEKVDSNLCNQKKLFRSHSYSNAEEMSQSQTFLAQDNHSEQNQEIEKKVYLEGQVDLNFKETCDYLRKQMTEMNIKMENLNSSPETINQNKARSKSLSNQYLTDNSINEYAKRSKMSEHKEDVCEDSLFKDDELDKTIVYFDIGCCDRDEIDDNINPIKPDKILEPDDSKAENNDLKKFIEDKLKVKIESSESIAENKYEILKDSENNFANQTPSEPSIFDKFFKSFSSQEETKKQNEDNLNRIFDLLNKTTVVKKTESLLTTTTIIPSTDEYNDVFIQKAAVNEMNHDSATFKQNDSSNLIKLLLKIDIPSSSSSSSSSPDEKEDNKPDSILSLKCPNNSKSRDLLSLFSSSSSTSSSSISPIIYSSKSLDDNKTSNTKKDNTMSMPLSSKSSPCINMKSHKYKYQIDQNLKANKQSPSNEHKEMNNHFYQRNGQKASFNSNQFRSFSSSNVNRLKETENNLKNTLKKANEQSKEKKFMPNNYNSLNSNYCQLQQQQIHQQMSFDLSRQWPMVLNNQEQNHFQQQQQQHSGFMNFNPDNGPNSGNYFHPFILPNNTQFQQQQQQNKPPVNHFYKTQSWMDKPNKGISTDAVSSTEFNHNTAIQITNFPRNNFTTFNKNHPRTNQYLKEQNIIPLSQTNNNTKMNLEPKPKNVQQYYNNYQNGNTKENMTDASINVRNNMLQMNFNKQSQQNIFKKNEYSLSTSPPPTSSSSIPLTSFMNNPSFNMMPLNNIINQSPKSNQMRTNHMMQNKPMDTKSINANNRNRFNNNQNRIPNRNDALSNNVNQDSLNNKRENDQIKQSFQNNLNKFQNNRATNILVNHNRQPNSSALHMVHSATYNAFNSGLSDSKMTTSSSYSESTSKLPSSLSTQSGANQLPFHMPYNIRSENNISMFNHPNNKNFFKKSPKEQVVQPSYNNGLLSAAEQQQPPNKQLFSQPLGLINGQKRTKVFYNKKP